MIFSNDELSKIPHILSEPRFATYLQHCGNNKAIALALYQWNMQISAAFVLPLHCLEVSIRNAAAGRLEQVHSANWPWTNGFIRRLPSPCKGYNPQKNLLSAAKSEHTTGKVIAELKFAFWQRLFTSRNDRLLWDDAIKLLFPYSPQALSIRELRGAIYNEIDHIRCLRNRIAHHEPIFYRDLLSDYDKVLKLITWRDEATANWINRIQNVTHLIQEKPVTTSP